MFATNDGLAMALYQYKFNLFNLFLFAVIICMIKNWRSGVFFLWCLKTNLQNYVKVISCRGTSLLFFRPMIAGPKNSIVLRLCGHDILHFVFLQD